MRGYQRLSSIGALFARRGAIDASVPGLASASAFGARFEASAVFPASRWFSGSTTAEFANIDYERAKRTGVPEVVFGSGKTDEQIVAIMAEMVEKNHGGVVMATRVSESAVSLALAHETLGPRLTVHKNARIIVAGSTPPASSYEGKDDGVVDVCVVTAGTSDLPISEETAVTAELMGMRVRRINDVGVAGLHRTISALDSIRASRVVVVAAGMDGALPSVVAGLVDVPVIGVPTSVGYGAAFEGVAPLLTMLNSCAPGIAVVNIDNGFGAAMMAKKIVDSASSSRTK